MMRIVRRHLAWIIGMWLMFQTGALAVAPLAFAFSRAGVDAKLCTCATDGPGHFCPMHGSHQHDGDIDADTDQDPRECVLRSGHAPSTAVMSNVGAGIGPIPAIQTTPILVVTTETIPSNPPVVISRTSQPDSPPPRR